ncbi:MAG: ATP-binding protein [Nannocystaceae bacterium]|nr:ATP-binding protein [Nannocystaceae bacterium]
MTAPAAPTVRAALDELVHQFSDPFAFVRELVQNAIDAGSQEVDVDVRYTHEGGDAGVVEVHVDDYGEGMTREIIEKKLTRLFSSSKEGDHTKIGKFGIGFVSVFALDPELVVVDTSRAGESWRVIFRHDRSYELLALAQPVDGTKITLIKHVAQAELDEIRKGCERSLRHWCRHVHAEIRFAGRSIREDFALPDAVCQVEARDGLAHVVVGHGADLSSFQGYYNNGLTLFESRECSASTEALEGLWFKISSPRLEHTLTRDAVIQDESYHRALAQVASIARGPLARAVFAALPGATNPLEREVLCRVACWHARAGALEQPEHAQAELARSPGGSGITIAELRRRAKRGFVAYAGARSRLTDALEAEGYAVVEGRRGGARAELLRAVAPKAEHVEVRDHWCLPEPVPAGAWPASWPALRDAAALVLAAAGAKLSAVVPARFDYAESAIVDRVAIAQPEPGTMVGLDDLDRLRAGLFERRNALVVNLEHPAVKEFLTLAAREPEIAGYFLAKALRIGRGLDDATDTRMLQAVMEHRWPNSNA